MPIMLNSLKRMADQEARCMLALLEASGIDVGTEEVLMNTFPEVSIQRKESHRLQDLLTAYERSNMKPSLYL